MLLDMEPLLVWLADNDPDGFLDLDRYYNEIWEHKNWVARQRDYEMPSEIPLDLQPKKIDFAAIKARIDLPSYISQFTDLRPAGRNFKAKCPLPTHADKTASMMIYPDQQTWWCYGCQQGRDIFDFAMKMEDKTAAELALG